MLNARQFEKFVDHWTPERLRDEPLQQKLVRAFMHATACVESQREVIAGRHPIRPLESFPKTTYPDGGPGF